MDFYSINRKPHWFVVLAQFFCLSALLSILPLQAGEVIPPPPKAYFNDYAHVVSTDTSARLNKTLEDFERETSDQIVVAVFPKMQSDSSIEDYTVRVAQSWKVGQKGTNNGAVLFVFIQDRKMFLQVGYGLEGALPDALTKQIIENEIKPKFRSGDYDAGLTAGVSAILAAARGEYKGSGQTVAERNQRRSRNSGAFLTFAIFIAFLILVAWLNRRNGGRRRGFFGGPGNGWVLGSGGFSSGSWGGWSGGGGGGGFSAGGGFSGGGGSFGGGGSGGSW